MASEFRRKTINNLWCCTKTLRELSDLSDPLLPPAGNAEYDHQQESEKGH
jgi:hypothetical protein